MIEGGRAGDLANTYYGTDRPQREEVLREFKNHVGEISAVITRNSYGCVVLNTARIMFVDVDVEAPRNPATGESLFGWFFSRKKPWPMKGKKSSIEEQLQARATKVVERNPGWGWRISKHQGYRASVLNYSCIEGSSGQSQKLNLIRAVNVNRWEFTKIPDSSALNEGEDLGPDFGRLFHHGAMVGVGEFPKAFGAVVFVVKFTSEFGGHGDILAAN